MKFRVKEINKVIVFEIYDNFLQDTGITEFQDAIMTSLKNSKKVFVIDLGGVEHINSMGLAVLIRAYTSIKKAGGDMILASLHLKVKEMLYITRIDTLFVIYDTIEEAVLATNN